MSRPLLLHCSLHKCLTVFYGRVLRDLCNRCLPWRGGYRHYNSDLRSFLENLGTHRVASVNNRALPLEELGPFRITRFVRDPRDLVVSGYFYHRRGAEPWVNQPAPTEDDWDFANGRVPQGLRDHGGSFAEYLQSIPPEDGLLAELEFREAHFRSLAEWPRHHDDILTFRYEDILGNEEATMAEVFTFYGLSRFEVRLGRLLARRHALRPSKKDQHVRDPSPSQWRRHFTERVKRAFDERHGDLLEQLGYPRD